MKSLREKNHYQTIKLLKSKTDIYITKSDKEVGAIIPNPSDYFSKMSDLLDDVSKFEKIGDVSRDNPLEMETKTQKYS